MVTAANEPPHATCIDVSTIEQLPGTSWVCGSECPRDFSRTGDARTPAPCFSLPPISPESNSSGLVTPGDTDPDRSCPASGG